MSLTISPSIRTPIVDLSHMTPDEQSQHLHTVEAHMQEVHAVNVQVFLLRKKMDDVLGQMADLEEGVFDIDGTLTGIGTRGLYRRNVEELQLLRQNGLDTTALTGRHYYQVADLWEKHDQGTGIDKWYIEQGFYSAEPGRETRHFIGTPALEQTLAGVRARIESQLPEIAAQHGVRFITTSLEGFPAAHQAMVSFDAHDRHDKKIADPLLHDQLLSRLQAMWRGYDPEEVEARTGSSSIGTFEWTLDGVNKGSAMETHVEITDRNPRRIGIFGDSGNDFDMFNSEHPYLKSVIVGPHTKPNLIGKADVATVGIGNVTPILTLINEVRGKL